MPRRLIVLAGVVSLSGTLMLLSGCTGDQIAQLGEVNSFLDPTEPNIRPLHSAPLVKPILDSLDPALEEPSDLFANAGEIQPEDMKEVEGDYRVGKNDLVTVAIYDLLGEGTGQTVTNVRVSESGYVALQFIKPVYAEGSTEQELQDVIRQAYTDAGQIRNARVTVTVAEERARTFTIYGNVGAEGQYQILQNDFRLLDALVMGKGPANPEGVDYCYIIREPVKPQSAATQPSGPSSEPAPAAPTTQLLEPPHAAANPVNGPKLLMAAGDAPATAPGGGLLAPDATPPSAGLVEGQTVTLHPDTGPTTNLTVPANNPAPPAATAAATTEAGEGGLTGFKFNAPAPFEERVIKVPLKELRNGHLQYNVVIRPGDKIFVPDPVHGEYYVGGHVAHAGVYSLDARNIDLKQAIVSAGMFDQAAIPGRSEIIRRIGPDREIFVRLDMDKVWSGEQPDIYLKPNDILQIGTNELAPFIAAVRNAFRVSYGFGFSYDINYAPNTGNNSLGG